MAKPLKVVLDTNIFLSAIFFKGIPEVVVKLGEGKFVQIVTSNLLLFELEEKLIKKFHRSPTEAKEILEKIKSFSQVITISGEAKFKVKDPKDHLVIETALSSTSSYIVTGDHHLLNIKTFRDITILSPREFLKQKEVLKIIIQ
jgi:putative PIN family toxin of toxin-antitoxin system